MRTIDFSSNILSESIPIELFMFSRLPSLDLSHNQFMRMIVQDIDNLAMSSLSFLKDLNLSYNSFESKISSGTQLQEFQNFSYMKNSNLCEPLLTRICSHDEELLNKKQMREDDNNDDDNSEFYSWFCMRSKFEFVTSL
ncbi:hypothetical protein AHAS_Ahas13G0190100 [Arachis hypogaea]